MAKFWHVSCGKKWHGKKNEFVESVAECSRIGRGQQPAAGAAHRRALPGAASTANPQSPDAQTAAAPHHSNAGTTAVGLCGENDTA